jgi:hypothetical protein
MAYDSARGVTVLFGGDNNTLAMLGDTWEFNGVNWVHRSPAHSPPARYAHCMSYDSVRHRTVMVGGLAESATWLWDGTDWTSQPSALPARSYAAMAFDSRRGRTVLFGGKAISSFATLGDTWEHDGSAWSPVSGAMPPGRFGHVMAYDGVRERVVLAAGRDTAAFLDTWEFRDGAWTVRGATLTGRYGSAMAYGQGRTMVFGGGTFPGTLADTRQYAPVAPAVYALAGAGCGNGDLHAGAEELPYAGTTFVREITGVPPGYPVFFATSVTAAPLPLGSSGMPGCTLVPQNPVAQVAFPSNTTVTVPIAIPMSAALAGQLFFDQAAVVATGANALGITLTNAQRGTVRLP